MMKKRKYLVLFTLWATNLMDQPTPEVNIEQGSLTGKISTDGSFYEYLGIPYATADVSNRFQAPKPPPYWKGIFKAVDEFYTCPQPTPVGILGIEDCLKINIYVPIIIKNPLPVMVFIHGGGFMLGSGGKILVGSEFLVKRDVMLVSFNYRLGVLGFMCLNIKEAPGNTGLKDQIAALRWIKKNIAAFGGDPDNVTVFGSSAGAVSVSILLASEITEGLFSKAIMQSGSSLAKWAVKEDTISVASAIAEKLGYNTNHPMELYKILSKIHFKNLIAATADDSLERLMLDNNHLSPCIEKSFPGIEAVLQDYPYKLLQKYNRNVTRIYGITNKEGFFLIAEETEESLKKLNQKSTFSNDLDFKSKSHENTALEKIKEFYFKGEEINVNNIMNLSDLYSHLYFEVPTVMESEMILKKTESTVFHYYFTYNGNRNLVKQRAGFSNESGACHGDELLYLFDSKIWPYRVKAKDQVVIDWMTQMWTNFAKYGHPTPSTDSDRPVQWIPSNKDNINFLHIGEELQMGPMMNLEAYKLWKDIYTKYRKK